MTKRNFFKKNSVKKINEKKKLQSTCVYLLSQQLNT